MTKRWAYAAFITIVFFALTAPLWCGARPLAMRYHGRWYFPAFREPTAHALGIEDRVRVDFKHLELSGDDHVLWPLVHWSPYEINRAIASYPGPPSRENPLGTDDRGRDVLARLLYGARVSLFFAITVWMATTILAIGVGAFAGWAGGWVDLSIQRTIEVISTIPQFFILIFLITVFEPSMRVLILVNTAFGWIGTSAYIRAEALRARQAEYVEAARACGASPFRILVRHVIPNCLRPVVTLAPFSLIANIVALTALDFMGLGLPPPSASWGELLAQGQAHFNDAWWLAIFPTLVLVLTLLSVSMIGEDLRVRYES